MILSVDRPPDNSVCKAREDKYANIAPHRCATAQFARFFLLSLTNSG